MSANLLNLTLDQAVIDQISRGFGLRRHNAEALRDLVIELTGDYDPGTPLVLDMATGAGKTYLMAAFIEYVRRQGVRHVMVITPGTVVQDKTVQNFTPGSRRYIAGADALPQVTTPQDYSAWRLAQSSGSAQLFGQNEAVQLFVFNIQQLIAPKELDGETTGEGVQASQRKIRTFDETAGNLYEFLQHQDDLVVIADESHIYGTSAKAFRQAIVDLEPAATIGLTASAATKDHVIFRYRLWQAISDGVVKSPVIAYRASGYDEAGEELQLKDALVLLRNKQAAFSAYAAANDVPLVHPVLFVVCADVAHATEVASLLRTPAYFGKDEAVLQVDNAHDDAITHKRLDMLDDPYSTVQAIVSVNKLKEGWDTRSVAVMVTLRAMASETLTQQTIGRGLRLPFGKRVGDSIIDSLDILSHRSVKKVLTSENVLKEFGLTDAVDPKAPTVRLPDSSDGRPAILGGTPGEASHSGGGIAASTDGKGTTVGLGGGSEHAGGAGEGQPSSDPNDTVQVVVIPDGQPMKEFKPQEPLFVSIKAGLKADGPFYVDFPKVSMSKTSTPFLTSSITAGDIRAAAEKVTDAGEVLERDRVDVDRAKRRLKLKGMEQANVDSAPVSEEQVKQELLRAALSDQRIPRTTQNIGPLKGYVIPTLMRDSRIENWTVKSMASAIGRLRELATECVRKHEAGAQTQTSIERLALPQSQSYALGPGQEVIEQVADRSEFMVHRHYGGWVRSVFDAVSFDSYSGEYALALLMDKSPDIRWWYRLQARDQASIAFTPRDRYFPDFMALDTDGVHWIIEGKADSGVTDEVVQAKRRAAEQHVRQLLGEPDFSGQRWGYLLAYEGEVSKAQSWRDLVSSSSPVVTPDI